MMKQNILTLILLVSILLNGFFLGGYWFAHKRVKSLAGEKQRIQAVVRQLDLDPAQIQLLKDLKAKAVRLRHFYGKKMAQLRYRLWQTLVNEPGNSSEAEGIIHTMATERERYQRQIIHIIQEFLRTLSKQQREKFLRIINDRRILRALMAG